MDPWWCKMKLRALKQAQANLNESTAAVLMLKNGVNLKLI